MNNFETRLIRNGAVLVKWDSPTPAPIYPIHSGIELLGLKYKINGLPTLRIPDRPGEKLVTVYQIVVDGYVEDSR